MDGIRARLLGSASCALLLCGTLLACADEDDAPATATPAESAGAVTTPTVEDGTPAGGLDGLREVSEYAWSVAAMVADGDVAGLAAEAQLTDVACDVGEGIGGPPRCEADDAPGTVYSLFASGGCEGGWTDDVHAALGSVAGVAGAPYALAKLGAPSADWGEMPYGDEALIFAAREGEPPIFAVALYLSEARIVRVQIGCRTAEGFITMEQPEPTVMWRAQ